MDVYSSLLSFLASVTVRSLGLVAVAIAAMLVLRLKAAGARHAVLTMAAFGMLLLAALAPSMPPISLRVLQPSPAAPDLAAGQTLSLPHPGGPANRLPHPIPQSNSPGWREVAVVLYGVGVIFFLGRLALGYLFTLRLVRASRRIEQPWAIETYESSWISVPLTVGWLRPKILLPSDWESWKASKLQAVLAHEQTHIARFDWAISIMAGLNRCVFWFNPMAWWLERTLASLAEQACDDAALLLVKSEHYAQALLDMAAAVKTGRGRLVWEAMAMAKAAEVRKRIERILDETRQIPRAWTGARWTALVACSLPLIYVASVLQLAAQEPKTPVAMSEFLKGKRQFSPADVSTMEQYLVSNPHDLETRSQLIVHYFGSGVREPRLTHILWLIANHPESDAAAFVSQGISPVTNSFNDVADYVRASNLWRQQTAAHAREPKVLGNAAQFFSYAGNVEEAERLLLAARALENEMTWADKLAQLYARSILGATGDPGYPKVDGSFANRVKRQLEESTDFILVQMTGTKLANVARRPSPGRPFANGEVNLDDRPMLMQAVDFGGQLLARARELPQPESGPRMVMPRNAQGAPPPPPPAPPQASAEPGPPSPRPLTQVHPVYPPLARQARIQGYVRLSVTITGGGTVEQMAVVNGHPLLVPAALEAVRQWTYPAGSPGTFNVNVTFALPQDAASSPQGSAGEVVGGVIGGVPGGVSGGVVGGAPRELARPLRIRVGGMVQEHRLTQRVDPVYPPLAMQARIQGDVTLEVTIGEDGRVQSTKPLTGHPLLSAAAQDAVRQWVYSVTKLNGEPVTVMTVVTVPFELKQ